MAKSNRRIVEVDLSQPEQVKRPNQKKRAKKAAPKGKGGRK